MGSSHVVVRVNISLAFVSAIECSSSLKLTGKDCKLPSYVKTGTYSISPDINTAWESSTQTCIPLCTDLYNLFCSYYTHPRTLDAQNLVTRHLPSNNWPVFMVGKLDRSDFWEIRLQEAFLGKSWQTTFFFNHNLGVLSPFLLSVTLSCDSKCLKMAKNKMAAKRLF